MQNHFRIHGFLAGIILSLLTISCSTGSKITSSENSYQKYIDSVTRQFAPDKRTAIVVFESRDNVLLGKTSVPAAKNSLLSLLDEAGISYIDSISILPNAQLEGKHFAIANNSVSNIRTEPRHGAELSTQATLGTPLKVWDKQGSWYQVQLPDHYLGWVDAGGIQLMDSSAFNDWKKSKKLLYTSFYGFAYSEPDQFSPTVSDLVYGDIAELVNEHAHLFYKVKFPDNRTGYIPKDDAVYYDRWAETRKPTEENLVSSARRLMGLPYLWGGTSFKGVDCSGFTKTVYFMNGLVLPRDASQQVTVGVQIDSSGNWKNLRPGDLLFFGRPASEGRPQRVVHVGMWIGGDNEFIHSSSQVRISSMNPKSDHFDKYELGRFLEARRISADQVIDLRTESVYETE